NDKIDLDDLARISMSSKSDLQRSFKMVVGMTIHEYIHYRRLTLAALDLKKEQAKILDIAMRYGYQTNESFSKAFKSFHGCLPSEAKNPNQSIQYFYPITIKMAKKGGQKVKIENVHQENQSTLIDYYYQSDEENRLKEKNSHRVEFLSTMHVFNQLFDHPMTILDCCAGGGIYAFELAKKHEVTATDLVDKHIKVLKEKQKDKRILKDIQQMNVLDMSYFKDNSFDVVLCMGALYHLQDRQERQKAINECLRVVKKGGIVVFSYLNRWGNFMNGLANHLKNIDLLYKEFDNGCHEKIFYRMSYNEMNELMKEKHIKCIKNVGVDHFSYLASEQINELSEEEFQCFMNYQYLAMEDPTILSCSLHGLWIGKKE
ncbi:MAG: methyltransferase domain-containing protein, partial [Faecalibacillus sp.]